MKIYITFYRIFYKIKKKSSYILNKLFRIFYYMKIEFYIIYIYFDIIDGVSRNRENRISDKMKKGETRISEMSSEGPPSEFMLSVLIRKTGALHQSKALSSEFKIYKRSDLKVRRAPLVQGLILGVQDL